MRILLPRRDFIDGIVITGGEPTVYPNILELAASIKKMGFAVKLDTNGSNPEILSALLSSETIDFVAMDIKTTWEKYKLAAGLDVDCGQLVKSIELIKASHGDYEFRTTCVPRLVELNDIEEISRLVGISGKYALQQFQPENTLDPEYAKVKPYSAETLITFREIARKNTGSCRLIGV